jgi:hypothetical protein
MNNNNQIKKVLVADITVDMYAHPHYDYEEQKILINNDENRSYVNNLENGGEDSQVIENALIELEDEWDNLEWEAERTSVFQREVAVDDLSASQMQSFLASNPEYSLKRVDGEEVSFKTKDTYYLEVTESKIDNLQNSYITTETSLDDFVTDKQVVNS